jgi:dienelactone hydrolase
MRSDSVALTRWEIRPRDASLPIRGDLRTLPDSSTGTAVIICHGFKGFREWGFFPSLARALAQEGHAAITFDFTRNGVGDDGIDFSALDRFSENTHSRNIAEIGAVIDAVRGGGLAAVPERIVLLGHSRGGAEALLTASRDARVDALATWAAFASIEERWSEAQVAAWERGETIAIANARTGQEMPIRSSYWEDFVENRERLDLLAAAAATAVPWLIVHGAIDETVAVDNAHRLFAAASAKARLSIIPGGSHTFGATHPYGGATPPLGTATRVTLDWLRSVLP